MACNLTGGFCSNAFILEFFIFILTIIVKQIAKLIRGMHPQKINLVWALKEEKGSNREKTMQRSD